MKNHKNMLKVLSLALILAVVATTLSAYAAEQAVVVKGVVEATQKDEAGNATAIQIVAGADKYSVANNGKEKELINLVGKTIEATGAVKTKADGTKKIVIDTYKVIE